MKGREMETQVSCFWCERLHGSKHPLSVCRGCADAAFAKEWPLQQRT
jgi:hypothetical protein